MEAITTENSIIINRPIEEVFDTATCMESCINWWTMVQEAKKITPGPIAVGTEYQHIGRYMGMTMEAHPIVSALESPHHFAYTSDTPTADMVVDYHFEPADGGTKMSMTMVANPKEGIIDEAMAGQMMDGFSRQFQSDMLNLKGMMEGGVKVKLW